jgi:FxsC-like protein
VWRPHSEMPATVLQHTFDDHNQASLRDAFGEYSSKGLRWLVKHRAIATLAAYYDSLVEAIARRVIEMTTTKDSALPHLDVNRARTIPSRFAVPGAVPNAEGGPAADEAAAMPAAVGVAPEEDDRSACFAALVGRLDDVAVGVADDVTRARIRSRYAANQWNWRPFGPGNQEPLRLVVQRAAAARGMWPQRLDLAPDLVTRIREAESRGDPVVVLVDAWSTDVPACLLRAQELDSQLFSNWSILIIWSDDPATVPQLDEQVDAALHRQLDNKTFVKQVRDPEALETELVRSLEELVAKLARRRGPRRSGPPGNAIGLPSVSAARAEPR